MHNACNTAASRASLSVAVPILTAWRLTSTAPRSRSFDTAADPTTGLVDIAHHYRFLDADKTIVGHSRIRFVDLDHLTRLLAAANLAPVTWYGDWNCTPLNEMSREFIVVTRRAD